MAPLKGQQLLDYLSKNEGVNRDTLIEGSGYFTRRSGRVSLQRTKFFEALAEANGHMITSPVRTGQGTGKEPTYRLKVGPTGLVPVSGAYTSQCGMQPGSYVEVIIEGDTVILQPADEPAEAPSCPPRPPVAQLADAA
jgi:hypothetical protein